MNYSLDYLEKNLLDTTVIIGIGLIFFIIGSPIVSWLVRRLVKGAYKRNIHPKDLEKRQNTLKGLATNIWRVLVVLVTMLAVARLYVSPDTLTPIFASAGVIGIALGFGAQTMVKDFLSGIFIISDNQYRIGDVIEIDGFSGTVEKIGARSTVLRDAEGNVHFFPNGMIQHVTNKTMGYSMAKVVIPVDSDTDIDKAAKIINKIGDDMISEDKWKDKILTAPSFSMLGDINASYVELIVTGKVQPSDQWSVSGELRKRIFNAFEKNHIHLGTVTQTMPISSSRKKNN